MAVHLGVFLDGQFLALSDAELLADQVHAGDLFGDRVLHLQAGVDLEEVNQAVSADQVLDGAGAVVTSLTADVLSGLAQTFILLRG